MPGQFSSGVRGGLWGRSSNKSRSGNAWRTGWRFHFWEGWSDSPCGDTGFSPSACLVPDRTSSFSRSPSSRMTSGTHIFTWLEIHAQGHFKKWEDRGQRWLRTRPGPHRPSSCRRAASPQQHLPFLRSLAKRTRGMFFNLCQSDRHLIGISLTLSEFDHLFDIYLLRVIFMSFFVNYLFLPFYYFLNFRAFKCLPF